METLARNELNGKDQSSGLLKSGRAPWLDVNKVSACNFTESNTPP